MNNVTQSDKIGAEYQKLLDRIDNEFTYHAPKNNQAERYTSIREKCKELAKYIVAHTPISREQSLALTKLREVMMWTNASIACNE